MQEFPGESRWSPGHGKASLLFVNVTWCGYCRDAKPTMEKTAGVLGSVVPVYSVDADMHKAFSKSLGVSSYPTIIFADANGTFHTYEGERTVNALVSFVCSKAATTGRYKFCTKIF